jgi:hypothetical protein
MVVTTRKGVCATQLMRGDSARMTSMDALKIPVRTHRYARMFQLQVLALTVQGVWKDMSL